MRDIQKVLFPTDFSAAAGRALPHAMEFARRFQARLIMLHVRVPYGDDPHNPEHPYVEEERYERHVETLLEGVSSQVPESLGVETRSVRNISPAAGILDFIEENNVDLTVMGTHGRSALTHFFLGSVAEKVVRYAPCPVLTVGHVREEYRSNPHYQRILVPFDFSDFSLEAARHALALAEKFQAGLQVLYVLEQEVHPAYYYRWRELIKKELPRIAEDASRALHQKLDEAGLKNVQLHVEIGKGRADRDIVDFADQHQVDLIVMGTHGLSGLDRLLLGSTTERVVRVANCPVLTVKLEQQG